MEIEKHEFFYLKLTKQELNQLSTLFNEVDSTISNLPDWLKERSRQYSDKLKQALGED
jgi:hypothetical protein